MMQCRDVSTLHHCALRCLFRKRRVLAHGSGVSVDWLPIPGQELVEAIGGMTVGHALQDV